MRVLLVSLRDFYMDSDRVMPPLGIMSIHAMLKRNNITVDITNDLTLEMCKDYTHICISCMTPQSAQAYSACKYIKDKMPDKIVIIGGPHTMFYTGECLLQSFDHVVVGDGEFALLQILSGSLTQRLIYSKNEDLNILPLPTREESLLSQYTFIVQGEKATTILTAKGCPRSCAFCESAQSKVRLFSPSHVKEQILQCKSLGFNTIMFFDDLFALSKKRVLDLCTIIKPLDIKFRCFVHADTITSDMLRVLKASGCVEVGFGAESGSQKILNTVNKNVTIKQNKHLVDMCNKLDIAVKAFLIAGLPGETKETLLDTERFIYYLLNSSTKNDFDLTIFYPYRGTHIRDNIDTYDITISNIDSKGYYKGKNGTSECVVSTKALSSKDISYRQKQILDFWKNTKGSTGIDK